MKRVCIFLSILMAFLPVVSCQDNILPVEDEVLTEGVLCVSQGELTKMSYAVDNGTLKRNWTKGDQLLVMDEQGNKYTFVLERIKLSGDAVFGASGDKGLVVGNKIAVFYAPGYTESDFFGALSLQTDIHSQNSSTLPALMSGFATVTEGETKVAFENRTAVLAIQNPVFDYLSGEALTGITVKGDNLKSHAILTYDRDGNFSVTSIAGVKQVDVTCNLKIAADGSTNGTVYIALMPNAERADLTITYTTSRNTYSEVKSGKSLVAGKCYTMSPKFGKVVPSGALPGVFSVSDTSKVHFAKANLAYNVGSKKWVLYSNQYDYDHGTPDKYIKENLIASTTKIGFFTWGYNSTNSIKPTDSSQNNVSTSGNLTLAQDWGFAYGGGSKSIWRTLTKSEWEYVLRRDGKAIFSEVSFDASTTVSGVILMPDEWDGEPSLSSITSATKWETLAFKGAVFLPAANHREGDKIKQELTLPKGYYWTSTAASPVNAYAMELGSSTLFFAVTAQSAFRSNGYAVRLAADCE